MMTKRLGLTATALTFPLGDPAVDGNGPELGQL